MLFVIDEYNWAFMWYYDSNMKLRFSYQTPSRAYWSYGMSSYETMNAIRETVDESEIVYDDGVD